jgi:hypothetical protein
MWGNGGQVAGELMFDEIEPERVVVKDTVTRSDLVSLQSANAAGLITGGLSLEDIDELCVGFPIVVTEGFGAMRLEPELEDLLASSNGKLACIDADTQLRAGVKRPRVIIPEK